MDWSVCLPTVSASQAGYNYPSPLNGSAQYGAPVRYLDLQAVNPNEQLAPNFSLDEIAQEWKGRYAVVQPHAVERLQDLRDQLGPLIVNSGYRSPTYNASIGGATYSRHMYGDAFDLDPVNVSLTTLQNACNANGAGYVGVYATHMHCDWRSDPLDPVLYGVPSTNGFTFTPSPIDGIIVQVPGSSTLTVLSTGWDEGDPLCEWVAFDEDGYAIAVDEGVTFQAPPTAASVEVWIGRALVRTLEL